MIAADQQLVARVQQHLDSAESPITLAELGHIVGISPFHLQRVFRRATGLTPREYAATRRLGRLKQSLRQAPTVTEALYEAGYGSSRALYAEARAQLGMTPRAYRRGGTGEHIAYAVVDSPVGPMLVAATDQGICALRFGERDSLVRDLHAEYSSAILTEDSPRVAGYARAILDHFEGNRTLLDLPLDPGGTAFQQRVWAALREIPPGETRSYQEVAAAIGQPSAVRAVAHACATNPVALLVPCHRVLRSDGALGGYRWGLERKQALLTQERAKHRPT
jgi:AraC family transcriptional regulator of adaptative response/methylated-DNA-[protein]-cysteine methyltransferase